ncbi:MAG: ParB N-terminal domain-containing protein [Sphingomonas sp.]|nr:ParB N-terminal domain-containing protein [Sphingomonas sp.]
MKLDFISLDKLLIAKTNMRHGKQPDLCDILPTIRARGVLQSLIVRPHGDTDLFEVLAGSRRYRASMIVAEERRVNGDPEPVMLPCAILDAGDDAAAVEASLIENQARLDPDEMTRWEGFVRLIKEGRSPEDIAATFGLPDLAVRRILALGNLLPRIRTLYRKGDIDGASIRHLTLASKSQQRDWLALVDDPNVRAPTGQMLRNWLFGGQSISVKQALFDLATYEGVIVADLFGEGGYFGDKDAFWAAQNAAIAERRDAYLVEGWREVVCLEPGETFHTWQHNKAPKRKGGRVYIATRSSGEVTFHEGYVTEKEARAIAKGETIESGTKPVRPELSTSMVNYIDLHRHAAARAALLASPPLALRLMLAHLILGSPLWSVRVESQIARNDATTESVEVSAGEVLFDTRRRDALASLSLSPEQGTLVRSHVTFATLFAKLAELDDDSVMQIVALSMGETLSAGSEAVELIGLQLEVDMADWWEADDALFDLIRDRALLVEMVGEVAGSVVAQANKAEKTKVLKQIIRDHLDGAGGRARRVRWVPRWMQFPPAAYTERGGVPTITAHARATFILPDHEVPFVTDEEDRLAA